MVLKRRGREATTHSGRRGDRRITPRLPLGWESRYVVRDENRLSDFLVESDQSSCVVLDLSTDGAGLELDDPDVSVGDALVLDLHLTEHRRAASIRLHAVVRHARADHEGRGRVRAGVEFVDVGLLERALLRRLVAQRSNAVRRAG